MSGPSASSIKDLGPIGRLGRLAAKHRRRVFIAWAVIAVGLGVLAPRVETALSGAGWEATGSESVQARAEIDRNFAGAGAYALEVVVHSADQTAADPAFRRTVARAERLLERDPAVGEVSAPRPGVSLSADEGVGVIRAGADADANEMVAAAERLKTSLAGVAAPGVAVDLTGASGMWFDFNEANREAMLKSELISWPVTMAILVLAFGSLVAAGLPLMLTIVGLVASAGLLFLGTLISPISIWAMNFALMFALALGIDYALFVVVRFRGAISGSSDPVNAVAKTMDTAGKAVLFSGLTVLVSLSAVLLVPSPAFRSTSLGIIVAVLFVLAATMTLLPAVLAKLGPRVDRLALPWLRTGEQSSPRFARWGERLWRRPYLFGGGALIVLVALALPVLSLRTEMPSITVVPADDHSRQGYEQLQAGFGPGAPGSLQIVAPAAAASQAEDAVRNEAGIVRSLPPRSAGGLALIEAMPADEPSSSALATTIDRLRSALPEGTLVGGAAAESHDLKAALTAKTPVVMGVVMALGFLLLLLAFQAPVAAAIGVVPNLLATAAAFGIAKLIFQDGFLSGALGFESQGFLDAWAPVFFFAMIFAISMDYTVFLLSSVKEHWDRERDARAATVAGLASSGHVINAAGVVMIAVFFTFALSGPLPPKEMGVVLGIAVLLDAFLVRLLLMPVLLRLVGPAAWWVPSWLGRVLPEIRFGHGEARPA